MTLPTPLDLYQLTFRFNLFRTTVQEDIAEFSLNMRGVGGAEYGDSQLHSAAIGAAAAWETNIDPGHFASNCAFFAVTARNFLADGHTNHEQSYVSTAGWVGTAPGAALPWETSLAVSLYTYPRGTFVANGRRKRGRFYLPPMSASTLDSSNSGFYTNSVLPALLTEVKAFCGDAQQDMVGADVGVLTVYSRADGVTRDVVQLTLDAKFDSQRRRENRETAGVITTTFP